MKSVFITILILLLQIRGQAQIIEVSATGTIASIQESVFDSSVQIGGAYSETFLIDSATPASVPGGDYYTDASGGGTASFGDYFLNAAYSSTASILANFGGGGSGGGLYGYNLSTLYDPNAYFESTLILNSLSTPAVAPTTSLSNIQNFPISDFGFYSGVLFYVGGHADLRVNITSYNVTTVAAPEPSACALGLLAFLTIVLIRGCRTAQTGHAS